jgi:hypothetical protein
VLKGKRWTLVGAAVGGVVGLLLGIIVGSAPDRWLDGAIAVGEWVAGLGALAAVLVALHAIDDQRKARAEDERNRRDHHARSMIVWTEIPPAPGKNGARGIVVHFASYATVPMQHAYVELIKFPHCAVDGANVGRSGRSVGSSASDLAWTVSIHAIAPGAEKVAKLDFRQATGAPRLTDTALNQSLRVNWTDPWGQQWSCGPGETPVRGIPDSWYRHDRLRDAAGGETPGSGVS